MQVQFSTRRLEIDGPYIDTALRDSNDILGDPSTLRRRMEDDGYLLIRGLHDREHVLRTRLAVMEELAQAGRLDPSAPVMDAVIQPDKSLHRPTADLKTFPPIVGLVESTRIMGFFERYLGGEVFTFDYKWVRLVGTGGGSGLHYDVVYMGRGTQNLYTCWTPIGDVPLEQGPLAILQGSHRFEQVKQTYGRMDVDRDLVEGWFSRDPVEVVDRFGGKWSTTQFRAGDALIFGMFTMHGSLTNVSNRYRLSSDTRYQLASEPRDDRWIGSTPRAHTEGEGKQFTPIAEARAKWGL